MRPRLVMPLASLVSLFAVVGSAHAWQTLKWSNFEAGVGAGERAEGVEVVVSLALKAALFSAPRGGCFVAPEKLTVTIDGVPMTRSFAGGPAGATQISGLAIKSTACTPATWRVTLPKTAPRPARSTVVFNLHGDARIEIDHLLTRRRLVLDGGTTLKPGAQVTAKWAPASDRWTPGRDTEMHVYAPNRFSKSVSATVQQGAVRFTVPAVPAGPAFVDLVRGSTRVTPNVARCDLSACAANAVGAMPTAVTIAP